MVLVEEDLERNFPIEVQVDLQLQSLDKPVDEHLEEEERWFGH